MKNVTIILAVLILTSACGRSSEPARLPPGGWIHGSASDVLAILDAFEALPGTPAANFALRMRARVSDCREVFAHAPDGEVASLLEEIRCARGEEIPEELTAIRDTAALAFAFSLGDESQLVGTLERDAKGSLISHATLQNPDSKSFARLLIPGREPAGPPSLSVRETLVQARVRPAGGLDLGSLIAPESQANRLFRLRSEIFFGHVLDGSWEIAIYMPRDDLSTPPMALALDFKIRAAAAHAMNEFVTELEKSWKIERTPEVFGTSPGACFYSVRLLPDLMPCYALNEKSIVVGWNPISMVLALELAKESREILASAAATSPAAARGLGPRGGLMVHLDRLPEADRRLQAQFGQTTPQLSKQRRWDRLRIEVDPNPDSERHPEGVQLRFELRAGDAS